MLRAENVAMRFGARLVLRNLSFTVDDGTVAAVVGANGSGKSTLLKLVCGLAEPTRGAITWSQADTTCSGRSLGRLCGLAAPDAALTRELSVLENLEFMARLRNLPLSRAQLQALLERWALPARANDLVGELSSGLRMRLQLAVATLHQPRILLLDEPAANLDDEGRSLLRAALAEQRRRGIALLATNDAAEAAGCDCRVEVAAPAPERAATQIAT